MERLHSITVIYDDPRLPPVSSEPGESARQVQRRARREAGERLRERNALLRLIGTVRRLWRQPPRLSLRPVAMAVKCGCGERASDKAAIHCWPSIIRGRRKRLAFAPSWWRWQGWPWPLRLPAWLRDVMTCAPRMTEFRGCGCNVWLLDLWERSPRRARRAQRGEKRVDG
jgi:hypothetical protein